MLWHTEVEGQKPADVAQLLGMSANSVSALAYRAREGLRQAFLNMHAQDAEDDACAWTQDNLGAYIRNAASKRDSVKVRAHIDECRRCMGIYLELSEVNTNLSGVLGPLVLGSAAAGYIAAAVGGAAAQGGGLLGFISAHSTATALTGVAAAIVVIMGLFIGLRGPAEQTPISADPQIGTPPPSGRRKGSRRRSATRWCRSRSPIPLTVSPAAQPRIRPSPPLRRPPRQRRAVRRRRPPASNEPTRLRHCRLNHRRQHHLPMEPAPEVDASFGHDVERVTRTSRSRTLPLRSPGCPNRAEHCKIATSNNRMVTLEGDCAGAGPSRRCKIPVNATELYFQIVSSDIKGVTPTSGSRSIQSGVDDSNRDNNTVQVLLEPLR